MFVSVLVYPKYFSTCCVFFCLCIRVSKSIYPYIYLFPCLFIHLPIYSFIHLPMYSFIHLSIYPFIHLSIDLCFYVVYVFCVSIYGSMSSMYSVYLLCLSGSGLSIDVFNLFWFLFICLSTYFCPSICLSNLSYFICLSYLVLSYF